MEPPAAAPPPLQTQHTSYPDSLDSSPRSRNTDSWDDPLPQTSRLRLMCSYGGHIVPRPHDKSLCYVGGDTRIVVVDRSTSLSDLSNRLSKTLLNGRPFTLKYQLPSEDLDSLISVTTDEDLDNMIDPYILASQAKQVFYSREDDSSNWYIVLKAPPRGFHELETDDGNADATLMPSENDMDMDDASEEVTYVREDCEGILV